MDYPRTAWAWLRSKLLLHVAVWMYSCLTLKLGFEDIVLLSSADWRSESPPVVEGFDDIKRTMRRIIAFYTVIKCLLVAVLLVRMSQVQRPALDLTTWCVFSVVLCIEIIFSLLPELPLLPLDSPRLFQSIFLDTPPLAPPSLWICTFHTITVVSLTKDDEPASFARTCFVFIILSYVSYVFTFYVTSMFSNYFFKEI
ncbi:uncharacterized protein LOC113211657 [Frankliniella occidentalis]|uniref:Uncharacterized protein LOC113211657 n=1 Tax=Frankliniella occidentalis TaxID=133901 RepID=A0A6J1SY82_FRAOC|nr:uncharacterized protein LOC113211657 [Frankliniella occidentalis]